jgi:hypothetical protein
MSYPLISFASRASQPHALALHLEFGKVISKLFGLNTDFLDLVESGLLELD